MGKLKKKKNPNGLHHRKLALTTVEKARKTVQYNRVLYTVQYNYRVLYTGQYIGYYCIYLTVYRVGTIYWTVYRVLYTVQYIGYYILYSI